MHRDYIRWLFDGNMDSNIPQEEDILKYNSPITMQYIMMSCLSIPKLTIYLNKTFNNFNLRAIDKKQFMKYIKHLVQKLNLTKADFNYKPKRNTNVIHKLQSKLQLKFPELKPYDIVMLCNKIDGLEESEKDAYYAGLGMVDPKKRKLPKKKKKNNKISLEDFMNSVFRFA